MTEFAGVKRVLVLKLRHIGDVLLTVPVFRAIKETFPGVQTTALVTKGTEAMLAGNPLVDEIVTFDRGDRSGSALGRFGADAAFYLAIRRRNFDLTVDLTSGDRPALISLLSGARYRLAADPGKKGMFGKRHFYTHLAERPGSRHTVLQNLDIVTAFGIRTTDPAVDYHIPADARARVAELFAAAGFTAADRVVHLHPTSRWLFKCWDDRSMAKVINWLLASGFKVVITSSPEEKELQRAGAILQHVPEHPSLLLLLGKTSLKELGAVAARAELFFGVDSAPMHIAAAVGTPVVALFGPSGAFHWGPWDNEAAGRLGGQLPYSARSGNQQFGKNLVLQRDWLCVPCGKDGCSGTKVSRCLMEISPEEVIEVLAAKLEGRGDQC